MASYDATSFADSLDSLQWFPPSIVPASDENGLLNQHEASTASQSTAYPFTGMQHGRGPQAQSRPTSQGSDPKASPNGLSVPPSTGSMRATEYNHVNGGATGAAHKETENSADEAVPTAEEEENSAKPSTGNSTDCQENGKSERAKPHKSYVALIVEAIENSSTGMLMLRDIYDYIIKKYPYYENDQERWQNSVRHNLSLNECFVKVSRSPSQPGRGSFWMMHPAAKDMFKGGSLLRRAKRFKPQNSGHYHSPYPSFLPPCARSGQSFPRLNNSQNLEIQQHGWPHMSYQRYTNGAFPPNTPVTAQPRQNGVAQNLWNPPMPPTPPHMYNHVSNGPWTGNAVCHTQMMTPSAAGIFHPQYAGASCSPYRPMNMMPSQMMSAPDYCHFPFAGQ